MSCRIMKDASQFLSIMRERYGISEEFVLAGRPLVDAIYAEFDGQQRAELLEFAESIFSIQASTEHSIHSSAKQLNEAASKLERAFSDAMNALQLPAREPVESPKETVAQPSLLDRPLLPRWQLN